MPDRWNIYSRSHGSLLCLKLFTDSVTSGQLRRRALGSHLLIITTDPQIYIKCDAEKPLFTRTKHLKIWFEFVNSPWRNTGLFEVIVGVLTTCHLVLQMQPHVISFYRVTSRIRFMFLLFPQVSRNWRYESEPPLKPSPLTCYRQFGTNSIIVLMFVESQRVHI